MVNILAHWVKLTKLGEGTSTPGWYLSLFFFHIVDQISPKVHLGWAKNVVSLYLSSSK